jgi:hypothetical protein
MSVLLICIADLGVGRELAIEEPRSRSSAVDTPE